jgi:hypothetical protein
LADVKAIKEGMVKSRKNMPRTIKTSLCLLSCNRKYRLRKKSREASSNLETEKSK